ncbi:MAG: hypothetical protein QM809_16715 [Gordonia sp. (in: high G+C Gram-positive bacteria)]|uniref:hypothetical protein n=1 Tax=Gordonia sp. (in: high G+C Gram-positive bacteria) TaxID=84139 RepID=UPI0039E25E2A
MRVLVLGARGAVGRAVSDHLRRMGHTVTGVGRTMTPPGMPLDLSTGEGLTGLRAAADEYDVVVNASGIEDPALVACTGEVPFVEISATGAYLESLAVTGSATTLVLGAGLAPGATTILAAALPAVPGDDVDVAISLGSGETHGNAAVEWTAGLVGRTIHRPPEAEPVPNLHETRRFRTEAGIRTHLRADFPDHVLIGVPRGVAVRSYLAVSSRLATAALAVAGRLPVLAPLISRAPHWGDRCWEVSATHRRTGRRLSARGVGQSHATALLTAHAAVAAATAPRRGPVPMSELVTVAELREMDGIEFGES